MRVLVITQVFGDYPVGYVITNSDEQAKVMESHPGHVVAAEHPDPQDHDA